MRFARSLRHLALLAAVVLVTLSGSSWLIGSPEPPRSTGQLRNVAAGSMWAASPVGSGGACSPARPCALATALTRAQPGDVVGLAPGKYPPLKVHSTGRPATSEKPVVIRPASGGIAELAGLSLKAPGVTVEGLRITGTVYVHPSAVGATLQKVHVDGAGVFLRANGSRLLNSLVENGSGLDGVQVKNGSGMLLQGNTIRFFDARTGSLHADCIQLFDVRNVVIRANKIHDCDNASIIFSRGGGAGVHGVLIESNFVTGCRTKGPACRGGTAIDLREQSARDVVLRNNTFAGGSVRIEATPGQVNDRNVFGYLSSCTTPMTNSVVGRWNQGLCRTPQALGRDGNRQGLPEFVDRDAVDFHVAEGQLSGVSVNPVPVRYPAGAGEVRDIDGQGFTGSTAGADQPGDGPAVAGPRAVVTPDPLPAPTTPLPSAASVAEPSAQAHVTDPLRVAVAAGNGVHSGATTITAHVTRGKATRLRFSIVGTEVSAAGVSDDGGRTWTLHVDTRKVPDGTYPVVATASDEGGLAVTSAPTLLQVDN